MSDDACESFSSTTGKGSIFSTDGKLLEDYLDQTKFGYCCLSYAIT
jgi:hypothetical protein